MSFLSILKKAFAVEQKFAPLISAFVPGFDAIDTVFQGLVKSIQNSEATITGEKQGPLRAATTKADFDAGLAFMQEIAAAQGKKWTYDEGKIQEVIAAQVLAFNKMAEVKASFKLENL